MMNYELNSLEVRLAEIKKLKAEIDELQELVDTLTDEVKAEMGDTDTLVVGPFKIVWKPVIQNRFDSKAFQMDFPDIYEEYKRPSMSRPFKIA